MLYDLPFSPGDRVRLPLLARGEIAPTAIVETVAVDASGFLFGVEWRGAVEGAVCYAWVRKAQIAGTGDGSRPMQVGLFSPGKLVRDLFTKVPGVVRGAGVDHGGPVYWLEAIHDPTSSYWRRGAELEELEEDEPADREAPSPAARVDAAIAAIDETGRAGHATLELWRETAMRVRDILAGAAELEDPHEGETDEPPPELYPDDWARGELDAKARL